ncbi:MAG: hypothetical protein ACK5U7_08415 [Bacteroidota bacterium]|jgi:hypothetical protein
MFNYDLHPVEFFSGAILTCLFAVWIWKWQEGNEPNKVENTDPPLPVPTYQLIVSVYDDDTATITAKDINGKDMPIRSQRWFQDDGLGLVGYVPKPHVQQYKIEPPQATLEASTELVPVAVEVKSEEEKEKEENLNLLNQSSLDKKDQEAYNKLKQEQIAKGLIDTK